MIQLGLGSSALDELSDLATNAGQHLEQILIRWPYLTAEELQHAQNFTTKQDGKTEGGV
jgi:hypothetical protein